ncbi:ABC transporter substrate-binding protein [Agaribacterium haliotis]|uniref:ABC transporter substrate-binding protein n=1 Tax=Agaribacterium haliotis TaxID=2013869 RepID=UPI000BB58D99|nr:ABC transporter substrate-binding protein [Agaribacterium haliotis]
MAAAALNTAWTRSNLAILKCLAAMLLLGACAEKPQQPLTIAVNPWPGYAYLHLADIKGFYEKEGIHVDIASFDSLGDSLRAYLHGRVDGLASTLIESVQAHYSSPRPVKIILVADYSNGADVIVAQRAIGSLADLKGRTVGAELGALGIYMLQRALAHAELSLDDVELVNVEQSQALAAMQSNKIDAYVTYPPVSVELIESLGAGVIFSSAQIPYEVIDTVSISQQALMARPEFEMAFRRAWQRALDYANEHPDRAAELLAERLGMSVEDYRASLNGMVVLDAQAQKSLLNPELSSLEQPLMNACLTLKHSAVLAHECEHISRMIY